MDGRCALLLLPLVCGFVSTAPMQAPKADGPVHAAVLQQVVYPRACTGGACAEKAPALIAFDRTFVMCTGNRRKWCLPDDLAQRLRRELGGGSDAQAASDAFVRANADARPVEKSLSAAQVVASRDLERLLDSADHWQRFKTRYPSALGWVRFSSPAYVGTGRTIVAVSYMCGPTCGAQWLVELQPESGGGWKVARKVSVWAF